VVRRVLKCLECNEEFKPLLIMNNELITSCPKCGSVLIPTIYWEGKPLFTFKKGLYGIWALSDVLVSNYKDLITLHEGLTPVLLANELGNYLGIKSLIIKDESRNPTGTFIDRGVVTAVATAKQLGIKYVASASLGDLGVSVSTYARRFGLKSLIVMPDSVSPIKAYQSIALADKVKFVSNYEEALSKVLKSRYFPIIPTNPYLLDGYRTLYYEIVINELLNKSVSPSIIIVPVGDGALVTTIWNCIKELGNSATIYAVKASSRTPLLRDIYVEKPLLGNVVNEIIKEVGGKVIEVSESEVIKAIRYLVKFEGILTDPVGASTIAALTKLVSNGTVTSSDRVLAVMTSGGLSDVAILRSVCGHEAENVLGINIGFTKLKILELIAIKGALHPYAIWKELRNKYGIKVSLRVLYQHVSELERNGLIRRVGEVRVDGRVRKLYEVTNKGLMIIR